MPHIGAAAILTAGATAAAGALGFAGAKSAAKSQDRASSEAIAFAREQEAEKKREWEAQQKAAAYQWQVMQANLAPYRAARAKVFSQYGIPTNVEAPPMPPDFLTPGATAPSPAMFAPGHKEGTGGAYMALMAGLPGAASAMIPFLRRGGSAPGVGLGQGGPGYAMSPMQPYGGPEMAGPPTSQIQGGPVDLSNLYNWADWQQAIGGSAGG